MGCSAFDLVWQLKNFSEVKTRRCLNKPKGAGWSQVVTHLLSGFCMRNSYVAILLYALLGWFHNSRLSSSHCNDSFVMWLTLCSGPQMISLPIINTTIYIFWLGVGFIYSPDFTHTVTYDPIFWLWPIFSHLMARCSHITKGCWTVCHKICTWCKNKEMDHNIGLFPNGITCDCGMNSLFF